MFGDIGYDGYSPASSPNKPVVRIPNRQVRDLATYNYRVTPADHLLTEPQPNWSFWQIEYSNAPSLWVRIGLFGVMNNGVNNEVLRIHETWAGRDTRARGVRAAFHDDVINFWRLTPLYRHLDLLTEVRFDTVIE